jgi:hypothetical protein
MRSRRTNTQHNGPSPNEDVTGTTHALATNIDLREWQAKPATECSMFSFKSDSSYPNHDDDVREAPTYYRRDPREQVKAIENLYSYFLNSDYSDEYYSDDEYSSPNHLHTKYILD